MVLCNGTEVLRGHKTTVHTDATFRDSEVFQFSAADFNPVLAVTETYSVPSSYARIAFHPARPGTPIRSKGTLKK